MLGIILLANGRTDTGRLAVLLGIIYPPLIAVIMERQIRAGFNTNKSIQNTNVHFSFYDDYFEVSSKTGNSHIEYENLYKVIETKNHFYPMQGSNITYIVKKSECSEELISFLHGSV